MLARLRQIPSWFAPENERVFGNVPRPPMPVGEFLPSAMGGCRRAICGGFDATEPLPKASPIRLDC